MKLSASVAFAGARTAVGETLAETAASVAAGIRRFRKIPANGELVTAAPVFARDCEVGARAASFLESAYADLLRERGSARPGRLGLILSVDSLAPPDAGAAVPAKHRESARIVARADAQRMAAAHEFAASLGAVILSIEPSEASLAARNLALAQRWLDEGRIDHCVVGGLGMSCDEASLVWRHQLELTLGDDGEGLIPSEAAAFVELRADRGAQLSAVTHYAGLSTPEPHSSTTLTADKGLSTALERAIEGALTQHPVKRVLLDSTGLPGRKGEWQLASSRTLGRRSFRSEAEEQSTRMTRAQTRTPEGQFVPESSWHESFHPEVHEPLLSIGDVGAATLALLLGLAARDHGACPTLIVVAHAVSNGRAAVGMLSNPTLTGGP